ncbi:MAG: glutamine synthetase [Anaerolineae bacterium]|nr:glutamine synthetase [Anaerolineae bacterium]MCA9893808.1 glutamine synthetase [Anaerolineae bacterium]
MRDYLEIPYDELAELNLEAKARRASHSVSADEIREERIRYLTDETRIKAVTVCFSDLEGRLHMLDYDKKFLLSSVDNLTFDGSSIRGFALQSASDLRLSIDWEAFYWLPADIWGPGKVLVFADVREDDGSPYVADMRSQLKQYLKGLLENEGYTVNVANEVEGFLFKGRNAEQEYAENGKFEVVTHGGYYYSLPADPLRLFIDSVAEIQRALGFHNEKDHPEVAPSQFEINYSYADALIAADQVQLYKLVARHVANLNDYTASFLPKPIAGVNGSGMHTNMSLSKNGENIFYQANGKDKISDTGWNFINSILSNARDICLVLNSSVNAYRRLDPAYEAPNEIKASAIDRGSMIRIPLGNARSARVEVRSVAPDANPYLVMKTLIKTGLSGQIKPNLNPEDTLPDNIYDAIADFSSSEFIREILGADVQQRFTNLKLRSADRCPRKLGSLVKKSEIQFHHDVTTQYLWSQF